MYLGSRRASCRPPYGTAKGFVVLYNSRTLLSKQGLGGVSYLCIILSLRPTFGLHTCRGQQGLCMLPAIQLLSASNGTDMSSSIVDKCIL
jgi:hypothetical protein